MFILTSYVSITSVLIKQKTCLGIEYVSISDVLATAENYKGEMAAVRSDCMSL